MTFYSYAQNYEDYMIWRALKDVEQGFYIDVGANDPDRDSVSKAFAALDWRGIEVEPLPHLAKGLRKKRPNARVVQAAVGSRPGTGTLYCFDEPGDGMSTFNLEIAEALRCQFGFVFTPAEVEIKTLNDILSEAAPDVIHWMKIDVEGFEGEVLEGLDLEVWRPWILVVEATAPGTSDLIHHTWEPGILESGYHFAFFDGLNRYYVSSDHLELLKDLNRPVSILDNVQSPQVRALGQERDDIFQEHAALLEERTQLIAQHKAELENLNPRKRLKRYLRRRRATLKESLRKRREAARARHRGTPGKRIAKQLAINVHKAKARVAQQLLKKVLPDPRLDAPSKLRVTLIRWASRGHFTTIPGLPASYQATHTPSAPSSPSLRNAYSLQLNDAHAVSQQKWDIFVSKLAAQIKTVDQMPRKPLTIFSTTQTVMLDGECAAFDVVTARLLSADISTALKASDPSDWVGFAQDGDSINLAFLDSLTTPGYKRANVVFPDMALTDGDLVTPLLLPGANYLHALNCPDLYSRFFTRAGSVRRAWAAGASSAQDIALYLLQDAHSDQDAHKAQAMGLPVISAQGSPNATDHLRDALATSSSALFPGVDKPIRSDVVDVRSFGGVSVVISTKDKGFYIQQLVARLLEYPADLIADIIIVSNNTSNAIALKTLQKCAEKDRVKLIRYAQPFHFSAQSNLGARHATGSFLLFLNDDIVPVGARWLEELLAPFTHHKTGATGPLLVYPDERIQHAGMMLGYNGIAGHVLVGCRIPDQDFNRFASAPRFVSSVTGAALMVRRPDFEALNGFDLSLRYWIQDVDLCLRLQASGRDIVYTPKSTLFHMESLSVKDNLDEPEVQAARARELDHFHKRWGERVQSDPFHPSLLDQDNSDCKVLTIAGMTS